ncbi:MAG: flagellar biosynthetic protein FliO [Defluviitaleaceae bacterium]|nr:flagellar biosynthetic protein FliO [Defluviitaleaceae bacterium]
MDIDIYDVVDVDYYQDTPPETQGILVVQPTIQTGTGSGTPTSPTLQLLYVSLVLILVLAAAWYIMRMVRRHRGVSSSRNIKVIEMMAVGPQSNVQLIQAGEQFFLVGVSRQGVTFLGEVSADGVLIEQNRPLPDLPFDKFLSRFTKKNDEDASEDEEKKD